MMPEPTMAMRRMARLLCVMGNDEGPPAAKAKALDPFGWPSPPAKRCPDLGEHSHQRAGPTNGVWGPRPQPPEAPRRSPSTRVTRACRTAVNDRAIIGVYTPHVVRT